MRVPGSVSGSVSGGIPGSVSGSVSGIISGSVSGTYRKRAGLSVLECLQALRERLRPLVHLLAHLRHQRR